MIEFRFIGTCNCNGVRNEKYQYGEYIVYIVRKRQTFHVKEGNRYIAKSQPIHTLCSYVKHLGLPVSEESLSRNFGLSL